MTQILYGTTQLVCPVEPDYVLSSGVKSAEGGCGAKLVADALQKPIGTLPLCELAKNKRTATVIISDHTRPVPSRDILPQMLEQMRKGNPEIQITLLVATGCHRATSIAELEAKLGTEMVRSEVIKIHNAFDEKENIQIGTLPSGAPLIIDRLAVETDLLVAEGFIEPHFFAGFSGGRKSVLPGVCDYKTVYGNHCGAFIADANARTGVLEGNPIHRDMLAAARMAKLAFIVNVIIDDNHNTVAAFTGEPEAAHAAGVRFLQSQCEVKAKPADIIITSNGGAPLDQNLYQCVKGLTAAEATARPGAVLIMCAALSDGIGGESFFKCMRDCVSPAVLYDAYSATPQDQTIPDQWQTQILARILMKHRVIFVTRSDMQKTLEDMKMEYAPTLAEDIQMARCSLGEEAKITAIPNGVNIIVKAQM